MSENLFKAFSTKQYEDAIKEALERLTGVPVSINIEAFAFDKVGNFKDIDSVSLSVIKVVKNSVMDKDDSF